MGEPLNNIDTSLGEITPLVDDYRKTILLCAQDLSNEKAVTLAAYATINFKNQIQALLNKSVLEENKRCLEIMKDMFAENFHYRMMFGEIKDPNGKIDVHQEFIKYQELEPERVKFAEWVESRMAELSSAVQPPNTRQITEQENK